MIIAPIFLKYFWKRIYLLNSVSYPIYFFLFPDVLQDSLGDGEDIGHSPCSFEHVCLRKWWSTGKLWMLSSTEKCFFSNCKYFFFFHCHVFLPEQCFSALGAHAKICGNKRKKIRAWTNLALFLIIRPHSKSNSRCTNFELHRFFWSPKTCISRHYCIGFRISDFIICEIMSWIGRLSLTT